MLLRNPRIVNERSEEGDGEDSRTLFCANLDKRVTESLLYEVFLQAGPVESAHIPKDKNGEQRTFGFVTYAHACTIRYALQLYQGLTLYRKKLEIRLKGNTNPSPDYLIRYKAQERNIQNYSSSHTISMMYNSSPTYILNSSSDDNSSPKAIKYLVHNDNRSKDRCSPDYPISSRKLHDLPKYSSSHIRHKTPYQRNCISNNYRHCDRERNRDHDRSRHYNNNSNRHSNHRSDDKIRR